MSSIWLEANILCRSAQDIWTQSLDTDTLCQDYLHSK